MFRFTFTFLLIGILHQTAITSPVPSPKAKDGLCQALTDTDIQSIPGWQKLKDRVTQDLGKWNEVSLFFLFPFLNAEFILNDSSFI